jgi:hypothetical protein
MEVHSGCSNILLLGLSNFGAAETSAQICGRYRDNGNGLSDGAYTVTDITEMDYATRNIFLGDPR